MLFFAILEAANFTARNYQRFIFKMAFVLINQTGILAAGSLPKSTAVFTSAPASISS